MVWLKSQQHKHFQVGMQVVDVFVWTLSYSAKTTGPIKEKYTTPEFNRFE